jgi:hypothetical protein
MLGGFKKSVIAASTLGLIAANLAVGTTPSSAAPGDDQVCAITTQKADVANMEPQHNAAQTSRGDWVDVHDPSVKHPWYGIYYPVTDPDATHATPKAEPYGGTPSTPASPVQTGDHFQFAFNGNCANSGFEFSSSGDAIGYCGRSVGIGTGSLNGRNYVVRWESVGSQLILLDPGARGSVNAQANPPGSADGSCLYGTATRFTVDGAIADVR